MVIEVAGNQTRWQGEVFLKIDTFRDLCQVRSNLAAGIYGHLSVGIAYSD